MPVLVCSCTDIFVCTAERSGDIELSSLDAKLSDDAPVHVADSANDSVNDQLTVAQPVGTLSGACPFPVGFGEFFALVYHLRGVI